MTESPCPCGSGRAYARCCGPYLGGEAAPDPESLMRSRYTAFCLKDAGYLIASLDPENRSGPDQVARLDKELKQTMAATRWLGLKVLAASQPEADLGEVEFAAFFRQGENLGQLHERSCFVRREGRWYYRSGQFLPPLAQGRNQACFCGSGKKFKRCHGESNG